MIDHVSIGCGIELRASSSSHIFLYNHPVMYEVLDVLRISSGRVRGITAVAGSQVDDTEISLVLDITLRSRIRGYIFESRSDTEKLSSPLMRAGHWVLEACTFSTLGRLRVKAEKE